jgi:flagellar basal-body rod modification protein FlgD
MGKEVLVEGSEFSFDGTPTQIGYKVDGQASDISLMIKNSAGAIVATIDATETGEGQHFLTWNGSDNNGNPLAPGTYKVVINATSASADATVVVSPLVRTKVTGVDLSGAEPLIVTQTGEFTIANILGVYDGSESTAEDSEETETTDTATASSNTASTGTTTADETLSDIISQATDGAGIIEGSTTGTASD